MSRFAISEVAFDLAPLREQLLGHEAGACASFEGRVRNHNEGQAVQGLFYESYRALAESEGEVILSEALRRFAITRAACVHRTGELALGDLAVWVGVSASHRGPAFDACRWIIDEVKTRVPIWKRERYLDRPGTWLHPEPSA